MQPRRLLTSSSPGQNLCRITAAYPANDLLRPLPPQGRGLFFSNYRDTNGAVNVYGLCGFSTHWPGRHCQGTPSLTLTVLQSVLPRLPWFLGCGMHISGGKEAYAHSLLRSARICHSACVQPQEYLDKRFRPWFEWPKLQQTFPRVYRVRCRSAFQTQRGNPYEQWLFSTDGTHNASQATNSRQVCPTPRTMSFLIRPVSEMVRCSLLVAFRLWRHWPRQR